MKKICETCQGEFSKPYRVSFSQWYARRFCSKKCVKREEKELSDNTKYRVTKIEGKKMLKHRYIMQLHIGRKLTRFELVHHINHNKIDNRIENLKIVSPKEHAIEHGQWKHPTTKNCEVCGGVFTPHETKRKRAKTCSKECRYKLVAIKNRKIVPQVAAEFIKAFTDA